MDRRTQQGQALFEILIFLTVFASLISIFSLYEFDLKNKLKHYRWNRSNYERSNR